MPATTSWNFHLPTRIHFGWNRLAEVGGLARETGATRVFAMVGRSFLARVGGEAGVVELLAPLAVTIFAEVEENPSIATVDGAAALCRASGAGVIVAIGGGSVLDAAKGVALLQTNDGSIRDYLDQVKKPTRRGLPLIAVPTTAGTGSEVTPFAVITNPEKNTKPAIAFPQSFPDHALVDPELTVGMPREIAVSTGLDAFTQSLEGFWSTRATEMTRAMSFRSIVLLWRHLEAACLDGDRAAIEQVALGSVIGGAQMGIIGNTALHPLSYPLTLGHSLRHGLACVIYAPAFLRFNAPALGPWFDDLAAVLGVSGPEHFADALTAKMERLGAPTRLSQIGVVRAELPEIVRTGVGGSTAANPRPLTPDDILKVLEGML
ncbi:iron-containing alcohol dehydrogenase [Siculibacillus lacustris]|nr:iron-containing alcohol dehydrogenase [Siculibacillus lacustris]